MDGQRRRVAAELHDGALQEITLARLQLDLLCASSADDRVLLEELCAISDQLGAAAGRMRMLMRTLGGAPSVV